MLFLWFFAHIACRQYVSIGPASDVNKQKWDSAYASEEKRKFHHFIVCVCVRSVFTAMVNEKRLKTRQLGSRHSLRWHADEVSNRQQLYGKKKKRFKKLIKVVVNMRTHQWSWSFANATSTTTKRKAPSRHHLWFTRRWSARPTTQRRWNANNSKSAGNSADLWQLTEHWIPLPAQK